jgi:hypothetical protein
VTDTTASPAGLDWRAVGVGALVAAAITVPAALVQQALDRGSTLTYVLFAAIVVGLVVAGGVAGRLAGERCPQHGALAAVVSYLAIQLVGAVVRLVRGDSINVVSYLVVALLAASCGTIGGYLVDRRGRPEGDDNSGTAAEEGTT